MYNNKLKKMLPNQ